MPNNAKQTAQTTIVSEPRKEIPTTMNDMPDMTSYREAITAQLTATIPTQQTSIQPQNEEHKMSKIEERIARLNQAFETVNETATIPSGDALSLVSVIRPTIAAEATRQLRNQPSIISADDITQETVERLADNPSAILAIAAYIRGDESHLALIRKVVKQRIIAALRKEGMARQSKRLESTLSSEPIDVVSNVKVATVDPSMMGQMVTDATWTVKPNKPASHRSTITPNRGAFTGRDQAEARLVGMALSSDGPAVAIDVDGMAQLNRETDTRIMGRYVDNQGSERSAKRVKETSTNLPREWVNETGETLTSKQATQAKERGDRVYRVSRYTTLKGETRLVREKSLEELLTESLRFDSLTAKLANDHYTSEPDDYASLTSPLSNAHHRRLFRRYFAETLPVALAQSSNAATRNIETVIANVKPAKAVEAAKAFRQIANECADDLAKAEDALINATRGNKGKHTGKAPIRPTGQDGEYVSLGVSKDRKALVKPTDTALVTLRKSVEIAQTKADQSAQVADLATWIALTIARDGKVTLPEILDAMVTPRDIDTRQRVIARDTNSDFDLETLIVYLGGKRSPKKNGRFYLGLQEAIRVAADVALRNVRLHSDRSDRSGYDEYENRAGLWDWFSADMVIPEPRRNPGKAVSDESIANQLAMARSFAAGFMALLGM